MWRFLARRALQTGILLFLISILIFTLFEFIPGDFFTAMELNPAISRETIRKLRESRNLDDPVPVQYLRWLGNLATGDLGYSLAQQRPAADLIGERLVNTLILAGGAFVMILLMTFPAGLFLALKSGGWADRLGTFVTLLLLSSPTLVLAVLGIYLAFRSGWFPIGGTGATSLFLPSFVLALPTSAYLTRQLRLEMIDALQSPSVTSAVARGLRPAKVVLQALREALNPMISLLGMTWGGLLSGSVVVERVFNWPGLGALVVDSLLNRDLLVVLGAVMVSALLIVAANLVADVLLAVNDPRIRHR